MTTLMLALALAAQAAPPLDPASLAEAELDALMLIESCRDGACAYDRHQLGEAFAVKTAAAAVLRGEIDQHGAANARFLAPDVADRWGALLPSGDAQPDGWVRDWVAPEPVPPAPLTPREGSERADRTVAPPRPAPARVPLELRSDAPGEARLSGTWRPGSGTWTSALQAEGRAQLGAIGVIARGAVGRDGMQLSAPMQDTLGTDVDVMRGQAASLRVGAGPRWSSEAGREAFVWGGFVAASEALVYDTWAGFEQDGFHANPAQRARGVEVGALGVEPLGERLSLRWDAGLDWMKWSYGRSYIDDRRQATEAMVPDLEDRDWRDAAISDQMDLAVGADLRLRIGGSALRLATGLTANAEVRGLGPRLTSAAPRGEHLTLTPRLGVVSSF